ncbi:MAG: Stf0 family sulfotransferase [Bacteroidota bacterium]
MSTLTLSYRIWFSQRSGSTLLCKALEQTGIAGKPGEHLVLINEESLLQKYQVADYESLKAKIWESGSSPNGVFGVKDYLHQTHYQRNVEEISRLRGINPTDDHEAFWADLFPNCQHLYLTRRNKIRQAVSWWKAIQDNVWHLESPSSQPQDETFFEEAYNYDALLHLYHETVLKECATEAYFAKHQIVPYGIVYEDLVRDFTGTIRGILDYLKLSNGQIIIPEPHYRPTANQGSEIWVERFKNDLQRNFEQKVY